MERCIPGTHLADSGATSALPILAELVRRLAIPVPEPFTSLADEAHLWAEQLPSRWKQAGRPFEPRLVDRAVELLPALAGSQGDQVLIHQDLRAHNVLRAQRERWLTIDPKPLHGEVPAAAVSRRSSSRTPSRTGPVAHERPRRRRTIPRR